MNDLEQARNLVIEKEEADIEVEKTTVCILF